MSNRVEELEMTVSELESTVRGLTDELVETKERLRALEAEFDVDAADVAEQSETASAETSESPVAEEPVNPSDKGDKNAETDSETNSSEDENKLGDDIIVA